MELLAPPYIIVAVFFLSAVYVHYRGRVRFRFARQLTDHSTFMAPVNALIYLFSAVPNRPLLDAAGFPELQVLRDNWRVIRDEALELHSAERIRASDRYDDLGFNSFFRRGWKRFYLKWYGDYLDSARAMCPRTVEILDQVPFINAAMFTVLPPGGRLVAHRDPFAGSLRYHLGLVTPNDERCCIYIDGQKYWWRDGEDILFDETYIHQALNESDSTRIILFCDIERPLRNRFATAVNRFFGRHVMTATAARNLPGDRIGLLNRLFGPVYRLRLAGKWLKRRNRHIYYGVKYALVAGLLYWLLV